jgi:hypothetical protein
MVLNLHETGVVLVHEFLRDSPGKEPRVNIARDCVGLSPP